MRPINQKLNKLDFIQSEQSEQSDYQEQTSLSFGKHQFYPKWNHFNLQINENVNNFCPYCGKYVKFILQNYLCQIQGTRKRCLGHKTCIQNYMINKFKLIYTKSSYLISKGELQIQRISTELGQKQFIFSANLLHQLGNVSYLKVYKKIAIHEGQLTLNFNDEINQNYLYNTNIAIVPSPHFLIQLQLKKLGDYNIAFSENLSIDLSQIYHGLEISQNSSNWVIISESTNDWIIKIQIELLFNQKDKLRTVEMMNYKYKHPILINIPLIKIKKIICQQKANLSTKKSQQSLIQNTKQCSSSQFLIEESSNLGNSLFSMRFSSENEIEIDLISYSKTQSGSKVLQKQIKQMKSSQIDDFISQINPYLNELFIDDYANYMLQTLMSVANFTQRLRILSNLKLVMAEIICSKQGTFTFQQIIEHINSHQEYLMISNIISQNFVKIAMDIYGNHFLRKLINQLPLFYTKEMISKIFTNFVLLINNKNSVCVLKVMIRKIEKQNDSQSSFEIRNKIISLLIQNKQVILKNQYGNYFIQQCYENFGQQQLKFISQFIFSKFIDLSKQKFSSSVICKCINNYWNKTNYYENLGNKIKKNQILQLYFNREGNKVLIELILSTQVHSNFKNKIFSSIKKSLPSRYNTKKWEATCKSLSFEPKKNKNNKIKDNLAFKKQNKMKTINRFQKKFQLIQNIKNNLYDQNYNIQKRIENNHEYIQLQKNKKCRLIETEMYHQGHEKRYYNSYNQREQNIQQYQIEDYKEYNQWDQYKKNMNKIIEDQQMGSKTSQQYEYIYNLKQQ